MQKPQPKADRPLDEKAKNLKISSQKSQSSSEPTTMDELLSSLDYTITAPKRGQVIEGTIISVSPKHLLMDIGGKSEAIIHEKEMPYIGDLVHTLKAGDIIKVQVVHTENDLGQVVVSLRKTAMSQRWEMLQKRMKDSEEVEVTIRELSKGGFLVDYHGLRGFVPMSQAEPELVRLAERAAGRKVKVKIIEVQQDLNRLIFSQQSAGGLSEKQKEALKNVTVGSIHKAEVTGIVPFGAFVKVAVDNENHLPGLIHISEIAWEKVETPADYLQTNKTVDVKVIGVDTNTGKLTLSLKQLIADPWEDVTKVFSIDQTVKGKISRTSPYGVFVSLLPGIEGLIHISKIAPGEEPKVGQEIDCLIEDINPEKRKISLSMVSHAKPIGYR